MQFAVKFFALLSFIAFAAAIPSEPTENLRLWNGKEVVDSRTLSQGEIAAILESESANSTLTTRQAPDEIAGYSYDRNCKGADLCKFLSSCDNARGQLIPGNIYTKAGGGAGATGVCSGNCGVFVTGPTSCSFSGQDMMLATEAIREFGCKQCGNLILRDPLQCGVRIDRVNFC